MKILKFFIYLIVFIFSLFVGFSKGTEHNYSLPMNVIAAEKSTNTQLESQVEQQEPSVPSSAPTMDVARSNNLLIIGVDQVTDPIVQLQGVWLVVYHRDNPNLNIIPIFPTITKDDLMRDYTLSGNFSLDDTGKPSEAFLNSLREREILWHNYVLLDERALNAITELLEMPRASDEGYLHSWQDDPKASINGQLALFDQLCKTITQRPQIDDISPFIMNRTPYLTTDVPVHQIIMDWRLINTYGESLRCEFPTLTAHQE